MPTNVPVPACRAWLRAPELREPLARIALGVTEPGDVERLTAAAPPDLRSAMPLMARCIRAEQVLLDTWERRREVARTLVERTLATNDLRTAVEMCRTILDYGLLEEPEEPRVIGSALDAGWALDLEPDEGILAQEVVPVRHDPIVMALVAPESLIPGPAFDEATEERIAEAIADAFCRAEGVR